jgi:hypothetical protein
VFTKVTFWNSAEVEILYESGFNFILILYIKKTGFLAFNWSAEFGKFLQVPALASHWLEDCANSPTLEANDQCSANHS